MSNRNARVCTLSGLLFAFSLTACGLDQPAIPSSSDARQDERDVRTTRDLGSGPSEPDVLGDVVTDLLTDSIADIVTDGLTDVLLDVVPDSNADGGQDVLPEVDVTSDTDTDTDVDVDVIPDLPDAAPDAVAPPNCGDGTLDADEECDDGNDIDTDECNNLCRSSFCGDGIVNATFGSATLSAPMVNAFGQEGYVCDDGASCATGSDPTVCDASDNGAASEHGICQALGFDRAVRITWGGGPGEGLAPMHHSFNWECFDYFCFESPFLSFEADCTAFEMLAEITCEGIVGEQCDDGDGNSEEPDASCRTTCVFPGCGDGVVDSSEECDNGDENADRADACRNDCSLPVCGDGIRDTAEECDDGDEIDDDECTNACFLGEGSFLGCADGDIGSLTGLASSGSTAGMGNDYTASCALLSDGQDLAFSWTAPTSGTFEFNTDGSGYDTALALRAAPLTIRVDACVESTELACNDDSIYGLQSQITYTVTAGTQYLIVVDGFASSAGGPYLLNVIAR